MMSWETFHTDLIWSIWCFQEHQDPPSECEDLWWSNHGEWNQQDPRGEELVFHTPSFIRKGTLRNNVNILYLWLNHVWLFTGRPVRQRNRSIFRRPEDTEASGVSGQTPEFHGPSVSIVHSLLFRLFAWTTGMGRSAGVCPGDPPTGMECRCHKFHTASPPPSPHDSSHYPFSLRDVPAREFLRQWHCGEILPKVTISTARQQKQGWACDLLKLAVRSGD